MIEAFASKTKNISTVYTMLTEAQGRRNGFGMGGGGAKKLRKHFLVSHLHANRIQFCA